MSGVKRLAAYASLYDVTIDWQPFIGPRSGLDGYYDACGGSGHAFKIGPAVGRELADWIVDGTVEEDFANFSYDRIAAGNLFIQAYGGNRG
jgi:glycine/D-amino acid oxidase-like deaminating enzyme